MSCIWLSAEPLLYGNCVGCMLQSIVYESGWKGLHVDVSFAILSTTIFSIHDEYEYNMSILLPTQPMPMK